MSDTKDETRLEITRVFNASPSEVFSAWLDKDEWKAWIGPEGVNCEVPVLEPIVGGRYKLIMHMPSGELVPVVGIFQVIDEPNILAFTWGREGGPNDSLVTVTLRKVSKGTELTLQHEGLRTVENRDQFNKGWESTLTKLSRHLTARLA